MPLREVERRGPHPAGPPLRSGEAGRPRPARRARGPRRPQSVSKWSAWRDLSTLGASHGHQGSRHLARRPQKILKFPPHPADLRVCGAGDSVVGLGRDSFAPPTLSRRGRRRAWTPVGRTCCAAAACRHRRTPDCPCRGVRCRCARPAGRTARERSGRYGDPRCSWACPRSARSRGRSRSAERSGDGTSQDVI